MNAKSYYTIENMCYLFNSIILLSYIMLFGRLPKAN